MIHKRIVEFIGLAKWLEVIGLTFTLLAAIGLYYSMRLADESWKSVARVPITIPRFTPGSSYKTEDIVVRLTYFEASAIRATIDESNFKSIIKDNPLLYLLTIFSAALVLASKAAVVYFEQIEKLMRLPTEQLKMEGIIKISSRVPISIYSVKEPQERNGEIYSDEDVYIWLKAPVLIGLQHLSAHSPRELSPKVNQFDNAKVPTMGKEATNLVATNSRV